MCRVHVFAGNLIQYSAFKPVNRDLSEKAVNVDDDDSKSNKFSFSGVTLNPEEVAHKKRRGELTEEALR